MDKLALIAALQSDTLHINDTPLPQPQPPSDPIPTPVVDHRIHYLSASDDWLLYDQHAVEVFSFTNNHWYLNQKGGFDNSASWLDYVQTWDLTVHV